MKVTILAATPKAAALLLLIDAKDHMAFSDGNFDMLYQIEKTDPVGINASRMRDVLKFLDVTFCVEQVPFDLGQFIGNGKYSHGAVGQVPLADVTAGNIHNPLSEIEKGHHEFAVMSSIATHNYNMLVKMGVPEHKARQILPLNVTTNFIVKYTLASLVDMINDLFVDNVPSKEYCEYVEACMQLVKLHWPWVTAFFKSKG
jgi:hypothetical protein